MSGLSVKKCPTARRIPFFAPFAIEEVQAGRLMLVKAAESPVPQGEHELLNNQPGIDECDGQNVFIRSAKAWQNYRAAWRDRRIEEGRVASLLGFLPLEGRMIYFTTALNETLRNTDPERVTRRVITLYDFFEQHEMRFT